MLNIKTYSIIIQNNTQCREHTEQTFVTDVVTDVQKKTVTSGLMSEIKISYSFEYKDQ